jgi:hypothetical protein
VLRKDSCSRRVVAVWIEGIGRVSRDIMEWRRDGKE